METTDKVNLRLLDKRPYPWLLQMLEFILIRRSEMRTQTPIVSRNDHSALARRLHIIDAVFDVKTSLGACFLEDIGVSVPSNASQIDNRVGGKNVLGISPSVSTLLLRWTPPEGIFSQLVIERLES